MSRPQTSGSSWSPPLFLISKQIMLTSSLTFLSIIYLPCHHTFKRLPASPMCATHRHQNYFPKHKCHFPGQKFFNSFPFPTESRPKSSVHIIQDSNLAQLPSSPRALLLSSTMCQAVLRVETESPCSHGAHVPHVSKIKSTHSSTFSPVPYMRIIFFF